MSTSRISTFTRKAAYFCAFLTLFISGTQQSYAQQGGFIQWTTTPGQVVNFGLTERPSGRRYLAKLKGSLSVDANRRVIGLSGQILSLEDGEKTIPIKNAIVKSAYRAV